jgi:hypothetical protein
MSVNYNPTLTSISHDWIIKYSKNIITMIFNSIVFILMKSLSQ